MIKKIEVLANLAVIITSIAVCSVLVKRYLLPLRTQAIAPATAAPIPAPEDSSRRASLTPGTKISLPGVDWSKSERTLVLVLSTTCHFCTESAPLYKTLAQQRRADVRLLALFPQPPEEAKTYLNSLGVAVDEVAQSPLRTVGASGTPTLLLVDKEGAIKDAWVGRLSDNVAEEVKSRVSN